MPRPRDDQRLNEREQRPECERRAAVPAPTLRLGSLVRPPRSRGPGFPANLELCAGKIDDPELRNGVKCVQRALHGAVIVQTGVSHFDQEQYVGRPGVGVAIEVRPRPEEREVPLAR